MLGHVLTCQALHTLWHLLTLTFMSEYTHSVKPEIANYMALVKPTEKAEKGELGKKGKESNQHILVWVSTQTLNYLQINT